ncbi:MAG: hypothetical protein MUO72_09400 [Bacteroidales bacterium]|nr:hypothetical protein [Bacteroidales bacterium]
MISLVTKADLDNLKYISDSIKNSTTWPQFVSEAQMLDVKSWLTDALLLEIIGQASTLPTTISAANQILLDGGTYIYLSKNYFFQGLKACIIYYAFARFTNRTAFNYTAAGIVLKDSDLSTPVSDKQLQRLETEARLTADAIKCEVITYLNRNYTLYPLWADKVCGCGSSCNDPRPFTVMGD